MNVSDNSFKIILSLSVLELSQGENFIMEQIGSNCEVFFEDLNFVLTNLKKSVYL